MYLVKAGNIKSPRKPRTFTALFCFSVPNIARQIDFAVNKLNAFALKKLDLTVGAAENKSGRRLAEAVDYTVARDSGLVGIDVQRIPNHAAPSRIAGKKSDLTIGGDFSARDLLHDVINHFIGVFHVL